MSEYVEQTRFSAKKKKLDRNNMGCIEMMHRQKGEPFCKDSISQVRKKVKEKTKSKKI